MLSTTTLLGAGCGRGVVAAAAAAAAAAIIVGRGGVVVAAVARVVVVVAVFRRPEALEHAQHRGEVLQGDLPRAVHVEVGLRA